MGGKVKRVQDVSSGREAAQFARDRGYPVEKVGSYYRIDGRYGSAHVKDCDRTMIKQEREWVVSLLIKIGVVALLFGCGLTTWIAFAPYF